MARRQVIVKRLSAIENFGAMDVLCSDKTGTLTKGEVTLSGAHGLSGEESAKTRLYAYLNAAFETSYADPIDEALRRLKPPEAPAWTKLDEEPYDFVRKRLSVLAASGERHVIVTKGALANVLAVCEQAEAADGRVVPLEEARAEIDKRYQGYSEQGLRVLGLAYREVAGGSLRDRCHEAGMTFLGFLLFSDPLKDEIGEAIASLERLGVSLKVITGDNRLIAGTICAEIGLHPERLLTGPAIAQMSDEALVRRIATTDVFAEVEPNQKARIILACRKAGHVVGYLGDGINDGPALHAADVGISVEGAADVAKEAADFVMLRKDLRVLAAGVTAGRLTFANTLKYVFMATSANFGNMFSMAGASMFLSFLPLLPTQILLTNLMTDFPEMTIAVDTVDAEALERPQRWDLGFIRRFMVTFGLISSVFDFLTFAVLIWGMQASPKVFRTGWFVESVLSASLIVLVIRTRRPFFRSLPATPLLLTTLGVAVATLALPLTALGRVFAFEPLPLRFYGLILGILALYVTVAELAKRVFYRPQARSVMLGVRRRRV
jgi:Mg2+-importing ATPase